jgi:tRNA threonylcarbamoyladenosine biosynthesis protein TsaB
MKILAVDSSAHACSVAVLEDNKLIFEFFTDSGLKHSQTLMQMIKSGLECAHIDISSIDSFAVSSGPGSFTGVRIGISIIKGLCQPSHKPCIGVSALSALAYNLFGEDCFVCSVMDARCDQVYAAFFDSYADRIIRLSCDDIVPIGEISKRIAELSGLKKVILIGDGAEMCYNLLETTVPTAFLAPVAIRFQRAFGVAMAAFHSNTDKAGILYCDSLLPIYLQAPQAERELRKERKNK